MYTGVLIVVAVALLLGATALVRSLSRGPVLARVTIVDPEGRPSIDPSGAARSVQAADVAISDELLEDLWSPAALEQLARTYWRFLSRVTLGLIRVVYTEHRRRVVLLSKRIVLLGFDAPEYELDERRGLVRWRIRNGLLVSPRGRDGSGMLQIDVRRLDPLDERTARLHVEVAVLSFYPAIALGLSRRVYTMTQSTIHVIVTHAFLRSLSRLDLADSRVGRFGRPPD